jgi:hypothetical protein
MSFARGWLQPFVEGAKAASLTIPHRETSLWAPFRLRVTATPRGYARALGVRGAAMFKPCAS